MPAEGSTAGPQARDVHRAADGRWYVTFGGGEWPERTAQLKRPNCPRLPNGATQLSAVDRRVLDLWRQCRTVKGVCDRLSAILRSRFNRQLDHAGPYPKGLR
jgi:hypothetical protein